MARIIITVDPGNGEEAGQIIAEVDGPAVLDNDNLHVAIAQIMRGGVHDRVGKAWYPPHQVRKIEYE